MSTRQVGIRFTDNQTGIGATVPVNVEAVDQSVSALVANSNVAEVGFLTSIELQSNFQGVKLIVKANGAQIATADGNANNVASFNRTPISQLSINLTA